MHTDPRVIRQISFFHKNGYSVVLSGLSYDGELEFYPIKKQKSIFSRALKLILLLIRNIRLREKELLWQSSYGILSSYPTAFTFILANDVESWPIAIALKSHHTKTKVIFDAHEQYAKEFTDDFKWQYFHKNFVTYLCKEYIPKADAFITVCEGIARDYQNEVGVLGDIVLNAPDFESNLVPSPVTNKIQLIHHGISNRSRKIEKMIRLMDYLDDRFELKLMLMNTDENYLGELRKLALGKPIQFIEPVSTQAISGFINQFDIGLFILEPVNFNYANALPNKFFEFIQARLAIAIGPTPEMKRIVEKEKIGIVTDTFDEREMAQCLNALSISDIEKMKENSHLVASDYSNIANEKVLNRIIERLTVLD